jgi:hypothetical protein
MAAQVDSQPSSNNVPPKPRHVSSLSSSDGFPMVQIPRPLPSPGLSSLLDDSDIIDEINVDLSFPPPGTDTISNASPFEFIVGQHVFWPTKEGTVYPIQTHTSPVHDHLWLHAGEKHGIVEHIADNDYTLTSPAADFVGALPPAGKGT